MSYLKTRDEGHRLVRGRPFPHEKGPRTAKEGFHLSLHPSTSSPSARSAKPQPPRGGVAKRNTQVPETVILTARRGAGHSLPDAPSHDDAHPGSIPGGGISPCGHRGQAAGDPAPAEQAARGAGPPRSPRAENADDPAALLSAANRPTVFPEARSAASFTCTNRPSTSCTLAGITSLSINEKSAS